MAEIQTALAQPDNKLVNVGFIRMSKSGKSLTISIKQPVTEGQYMIISLKDIKAILEDTSGQAFGKVGTFVKQ